MKPTELDLNLDGMRADALREMLDALRTALQKCDDIEAMARVLHSKAATNITARVQRNTNGNGTHPTRLLGRPKGSRNEGPKTNKQELRDAALAIVDKSGPNGIDSLHLEKQLRAVGVFSPAITPASARTLINIVLKPAVNEKRIRSYRLLGLNGRMFFYPPTGPMNIPTTAPIGGTAQPPVQPIPDGVGRTARLREFLTSELISQTEPRTASELRQLAMSKGGFDVKWGNGDTLQNQVGRLLREMIDEGKAKRFGDGRSGPKGIAFTYVILRPKLSVSKN